MSGRHTGRTNGRLRIAALPATLKLIFKLAPRQLNDEIAFAKAELKRKGIQFGVAAAFLAVALIFVLFLVIGLIVAAIMGLATIMPAWLAALLVCAAFLVIALIVGLIGYSRFKKAMPLIPEVTIRGLKYDLGIAKEGSSFDAAVLNPGTPEAKAAKAAKEQAAAKAKAEKEAKKAAEQPDLGRAPTEDDLLRRLDQRRRHLTGVRDDLGAELDVKPQAQALLAMVQHRLEEGKELVDDRIAAFRGPSGSTTGSTGATRITSSGSAAASELAKRWKPLTALAASAAAFVILLRRLLQD
ncbi:phage holin family protein [Arthrobacter sp. B3I4]|uniref:phage holin family protein n=1 Tax=Arthrobacter sp. B3I4 TaxID=3042267 RepID=UPI00278844D5|nr:phage holin family protein [Arthrobacter sp. B3I4]MDQ0757030.1 Flp pilus assembly protein TadB [Arthrobacter sp. B3I4]